MPTPSTPSDPQSFRTFGALLRYLRRRARLTQRELGIAVGYSEGHINRFEKDRHLPDPAVVAALFIPELGLTQEPGYANRLIELASPVQAGAQPPEPTPATLEPVLEALPPARAQDIPRPRLMEHVRALLAAERRVSLYGLPGVGKTSLGSALAREYAARDNAAQVPVFWLTLSAGIPVTREALLNRIAGFLYASGQGQFAPIFSTDPRVNRSFSPDQHLAMVVQALARQPALLCFDNGEHLLRDEGCRELLKHLCAATPAYVLLMTREFTALEGLTEIPISGLEKEEGLAYLRQSAGALVHELSGSALAKVQAAWLLEKTAGNPMLLRLAVAQIINAPLDAGDFIARLETQPQVAAYLLQTIQHELSPSGWGLLMLLATLQKPVDLYDPYLLELAQSVAEITDTGQAIQELQRRRLIESAARAQLHPLIRDYAFQALRTEPATRRRMHHLAGDWFRDASRDVFSAAWHYATAGLADEAIQVLEENIHTLTALGQAEGAVTILDDLETQLKRQRVGKHELLRSVLVLRGRLLTGTLRLAEGDASFRQAIAMESSPAVRASIIAQLAELTSQRSDFPETLRLVKAAQDSLSPDDLLLNARLAVIECITLDYMGKDIESEQAALRALALAGQMAGMPLTITGEIRMRAEMQLGSIARNRRDLPTAMAKTQAALAIARAIQHQRGMNLCLSFTGGLLYDLGELDESFRVRSEGLEGLMKIGDVHSAAYLLTHLADIHHIRLEIPQALEKLAQAAQTLRAVADMRGLAAAESLRAGCLLWDGQVTQARAVIDQAILETQGKGTERLWGYRLNKLAMVQLAQGETAPALATLQQAIALPAAQANRMMQFDLHTTLILAHLAAGDLTCAQETAAESPRVEGLSRWALFERDLVEGFLELSRGCPERAGQSADLASRQAEAYPLYRQRAEQLRQAAGQRLPPARYAEMLWVQAKS